MIGNYWIKPQSMKIFLFLFSFLLTTASYLIFSNKVSSSSSSSSLIFLEARRSMREQAMSPLNHKNGPEKTKIPVEYKERAVSQKDSKEHEPLSSSNHLDELIYHIDYHGVTTHPTPTPKHPKP